MVLQRASILHITFKFKDPYNKTWGFVCFFTFKKLFSKHQHYDTFLYLTEKCLQWMIKERECPERSNKRTNGEYGLKQVGSSGADCLRVSLSLLKDEWHPLAVLGSYLFCFSHRNRMLVKLGMMNTKWDLWFEKKSTIFTNNFQNTKMAMTC